MSKITLTMVVRNEAERYLREMLQSHLEYIDEAVIIDDGSDDLTTQICWETCKHIRLHLIRYKTSKFHSEFFLRKQQWQATLATNPEWILSMDADECFERGAAPYLRQIIEQQESDVIAFRMYDMWNETHYREDKYWNLHQRYVPLLVRHRPERSDAWRETAQHCGRFPLAVYSEKAIAHPLRVQHWGWAREEDRKSKYARYKQLDPKGEYGSLQHYESILDPNPNLLPW